MEGTEPLPRAARHEDVDAAERRPLDPLLGPVAIERPVQGDRDHRGGDLATPPRRGAVVLGGEERVVVPVAAGEVAHGVRRGPGQELPPAGRRPVADQRHGPLDVLFLELEVGRLLELLGRGRRHGSPSSGTRRYAKEYTEWPPGRRLSHIGAAAGLGAGSIKGPDGRSRTRTPGAMRTEVSDVSGSRRRAPRDAGACDDEPARDRPPRWRRRCPRGCAGPRRRSDCGSWERGARSGADG